MCSKKFIAFKGPLTFYKNIKAGYATLEKAEGRRRKIISIGNKQNSKRK